VRRWKDYQGNEIDHGDFVAYNYSGDVAPGRVVGWTGSHVKIQLLAGYRSRQPGKPHISKVKRGGSILVIKKKQA
jgi:hypothetical protein